jgi:hypothetical protein
MDCCLLTVTDCGEDVGSVIEVGAGGVGDGVPGWIHEERALERGC